MGNVISTKASIEDKYRDLRLTLQRAPHVSATFGEDAVRFLGDVHAAADQLEGDLEAARTSYLDLVAQQRAMDHRCNDLIGRIKDELFNEIGRTRRDPQFKRMFPVGKRTYDQASPLNKPFALRRMARMLETHRQLQVSEERIGELASELRAAADTLQALNDQVRPQQEETRLLEAQWSATADEAQQQLSRLKRYWLAMGHSEVDVHRIIPDRPASKPQRAATPAVVLAPVSDEDEASDDDASIAAK